MRIVDLTLPIEHGMGRGGAQVKYEVIESFNKKNFQVSTIFMNAH